MIKFKKIEIEGFCSIQEQEIQLDNRGLIIIRGATGSGKSTLLNAIVWALYGKTLKGVDPVTLKEFRPKGYKGVKVTLYWEKDERYYKITRCNSYIGKVEGAKGGNRLLFFIDGTQVDIKGKGNVQDAIEESLQMTYPLFKSSIAFGQKLKRIVQESSVDKKKLFEELFELNVLSAAREIAKQYREKHLGQFTKMRDKYTDLVEKYKSTKKLYEDLKQEEKDFKDANKEHIQMLRKHMNELIVKRDKIVIAPASLTKAESELARFENNLEQVKSKLSSIEKKLSKLYKGGQAIRELFDNILSLIDAKKYKTLRKKLNVVRELFEDRDLLSKKKSKLALSVSEGRANIQEIKANRRQHESLSRQIESLENDIERSRGTRKQLRSKEHRAEIENLGLKIKKLKEEIMVSKKDFEIYDWMVKDPLGNAGIKNWLFDQALTRFNQLLDSFVELVGFRINFSIDNNARRDVMTTIETNGQVHDYSDLSGGEQTLVDITMAFAIHMFTTANAAINMLWLDEVFEGLDNDSVDLVMTIINDLSQGTCVYLITHHDSIRSSNSKIWRAIKDDNGVTTIKS